MSSLSNILAAMSGSEINDVSEQLLFNKVVGFKGIVPGVGTSTILQNVAIALSEKTKYKICVLDMNILYPIQHSLLMKDSKVPNKKKDIMDYSGNLSEIILYTQYNNVYLIEFSNRGLSDMFSSKDIDTIISEIIDTSKLSFDVILIDLSHELTVMNTRAAIKCNKIIQVGDQSLKCLTNLKKSLNTQATLAISPLKSNKVVLNKVSEDVVAFTTKVLEEAGLKVIAQINNSEEILKAGISGKRLWYESSKEKYINFSSAIDTIVDELLERTPLNNKFIEDDIEIEERKPTENEIENSFKSIKNHGKETVLQEENNDEDIIIEL
ncbi:AAA family ATPase [Clostridioides sp. GD02377]|uniref:AAA family ATPase n=1 Tax=unclassified Clostridioides TaxID=2635829 RepID=UPI00389B6AB4